MREIVMSSREIARRILAAETSFGERWIPPEEKERVVNILKNYIVDQLDDMEVELILSEVRSRYSGGPVGPYTMGGAYLDGALQVLYAEYATDVPGEIWELAYNSGDPEEYMLTNYYGV